MSEKKMINPELLQVVVKRWNNPRFAGGKMYLVVALPVGFQARRVFKRASEAEAYAGRLLARWKRLYAAAVAAVVEPAGEVAG